jgi:hypothetical protein
MTIFNERRGKIINAESTPIFRLLGLGIAALVMVILLFNAVARVESGNVGVLTLFGRVTGEVLPEGIHLVSPFKIPRRPGKGFGCVSEDRPQLSGGTD